MAGSAILLVAARAAGGTAAAGHAAAQARASATTHGGASDRAAAPRAVRATDPFADGAFALARDLAADGPRPADTRGGTPSSPHHDTPVRPAEAR